MAYSFLIDEKKQTWCLEERCYHQRNLTVEIAVASDCLTLKYCFEVISGTVAERSIVAAVVAVAAS